MYCHRHITIEGGWWPGKELGSLHLCLLQFQAEMEEAPNAGGRSGSRGPGMRSRRVGSLYLETSQTVYFKQDCLSLTIPGLTQ